MSVPWQKKVLGDVEAAWKSRTEEPALLFRRTISAAPDGEPDRRQILPVAEEWQRRPLESICAVVFLDAIHCNLCMDDHGPVLFNFKGKDHQEKNRGVVSILFGAIFVSL